jgi:hypothetical protein
MAHLTKLEQETVITFNAQEKHAEVHTAMQRVQTKLDRNPNAKVMEESMHGSTRIVRYKVPLNVISFRRGKLDVDGEDGDAETKRPETKAFPCPHGCKSFGSKQGLKTHLLKVHQEVASA